MKQWHSIWQITMETLNTSCMKAGFQQKISIIYLFLWVEWYIIGSFKRVVHSKIVHQVRTGQVKEYVGDIILDGGVFPIILRQDCRHRVWK